MAVPVSAIAGMEKLNDAGYKLLNITQIIGYWVLGVTTTYNVIKSGVGGDVKKIGNIIISGIIIYGSLYFLPWAFHLVENIF